jgi:hypothetical protein
MHAASAQGLTIVALLALAGCGRGAPSSAAAETHVAETDSADTDDPLSEEIVPDGSSPKQVLAIKAKKYARGLLAEGAAIVGELPQGGHSDHLTVLRGSFCYRILGVGGDGVEDLDLILYDPNGVQLQQDPAQDRFPVLGIGAEICPVMAGAYRIQVQMYKGTGAFAVGVYRTP